MRKDNIERDREVDSLVFGGVKVGQLRLREISVVSVKEKESLKVITIGPSRQRGGGNLIRRPKTAFVFQQETHTPW